MGRADLELEYHFTKKRFLWNEFLPVFPLFYIYDRLYVIEKIFPRFDHYHNGGLFKGWIAKYHGVGQGKAYK